MNFWTKNGPLDQCVALKLDHYSTSYTKQQKSIVCILCIRDAFSESYLCVSLDIKAEQMDGQTPLLLLLLAFLLEKLSHFCESPLAYSTTHLTTRSFRNAQLQLCIHKTIYMALHLVHYGADKCLFCGIVIIRVLCKLSRNHYQGPLKDKYHWRVQQSSTNAPLVNSSLASLCRAETELHFCQRQNKTREGSFKFCYYAVLAFYFCSSPTHYP